MPKKTPAPNTPEEVPQEEEIPEVEDLKALMMLMIDDYFVVVDYFDDKGDKTEAVAAAKRLARYTKSISNFGAAEERGSDRRICLFARQI